MIGFVQQQQKFEGNVKIAILQSLSFSIKFCSLSRGLSKKFDQLGPCLDPVKSFLPN